MQLTRTAHSHSHSHPPDDRQMTSTRHLRRRRSHIRTRSGGLGQSNHQGRRRSESSYSTSSSSRSSSSGGEHHHRGKEISATLVGAAGGGAFAKEVLGGGKLATLGGAVAGAVAANALEKRHERYLFPLSHFPFSRDLCFFIIPHAHPTPPSRSILKTPPYPPRSENETKNLPIFLKYFLDTKTSAAVIFQIENTLTITDIIITIITIAALSIRARSKMRLKRN